MFRVANAFLATAALLAASVLFQAGTATGVQAGQAGAWRVGGVAASSHAGVSGKRTYRKKAGVRAGRAHRRSRAAWHGVRRGRVSYSAGHPAAASGAMLAGRVAGRRARTDARGWHGRSGPKIIRLSKPSWRGHRHGGRRGGDNIAIIVGQGGAAPSGGSAAVLEGGRCEAGAYCTLRLGAHASAPKIITLNTSGSAITETGFE